MFNGVAPKVDRALLLAREEAELWMLAGAKGLSAVVAARRCFEQALANKFIFIRVRSGWCAKGHKVYNGSG